MDGRKWFFSEMVRGWSPKPDDKSPWYEIDFGRVTSAKEARLSFYADDKNIFAPESFTLEAWDGSEWKELGAQKPIANTDSALSFPVTETSKIRVQFRASRPFRLVELELY